jgi:hypothetical protein
MISAIAIVAIAYAVIKTKVEQLIKDRDADKAALDKHLEAASAQLQSALTALTAFTHEQSVINQFTAKTLEGIVRKQEELERRISDQSSTVQLLVELVKRIERTNVE